MRSYKKYKPTGNELIGDIPEHWSIKRLKNLVSPKITDGPHETPELVDDDDSVPFISAEAITEIGIDYNARGGNISLELDIIYSQKCKPKRNDIFIVKSGSTTGRIGYVETDMNFNIWSPLALVRSDKQTSSRFLYYHLSSDSSQRQIQNTWSFGTQPNIGMGVIERLQIAIPPLPEQLIISSYLDEQTQKIDKLIANKKAQKEKLNELRQIEINNAVTKGVNKNVKLKNSEIEWLGKIPMHWEVKRIKNLVNQISIKSSEILENDFLVALENIESNTGKYIETVTEYENNGIIFKKGNLLYNKLRPYLNKIYQAEKDGICVGDIIVIECSAKINPTFLQYRMLSEAFCSIVMSSVYGAKMPRTGWQFISNLKIGLPAMEEQIEIANHLQHRMKSINALIKIIETQVEKLQELRKIKIFEAITGKIKIEQLEEATV